jgi:hypothetical protein
VPGAAGRGRVAEQAPGFGDGERDHPGVGGRGLVREYRGGCLGAGAAAQQGGGDGADGQGGHDQDGVPGDRGVQADLGLVEPEAVLPELEIFFSRPPLIPVKKKSSLAFRVHPGRY